MLWYINALYDYTHWILGWLNGIVIGWHHAKKAWPSWASWAMDFGTIITR